MYTSFPACPRRVFLSTPHPPAPVCTHERKTSGCKAAPVLSPHCRQKSGEQSWRVSSAQSFHCISKLGVRKKVGYAQEHPSWDVPGTLCRHPHYVCKRFFAITTVFALGWESQAQNWAEMHERWLQKPSSVLHCYSIPEIGSGISQPSILQQLGCHS